MKPINKKEIKDDMLAKVLASIIDGDMDTDRKRMQDKGIKVIELNISNLKPEADMDYDEDYEADMDYEEGSSHDMLARLKKKKNKGK